MRKEREPMKANISPTTYEEYEELVRTTTGGHRERVLVVASHDGNLTVQQKDRLREIAREASGEGETHERT